MKVIKNINNNISLCLDNNHQQVIAFGKGIGFCKPPYELDVSKIERTFYDIDPIYVNMIQAIPEDVIDVAAKVIDYGRTKVDYLMNSSITFTLADHLAFAIQRYRKNMVIKMPVYYDIKALYEKEYEIGKYAYQLVKKRFGIALPKDEITGVALHLINAAAMTKTSHEEADHTAVIESIKELIENFFQIKILEDSFDYSRFVSHLQYLLKRGKEGSNINSDNFQLFTSLKENFPDVYECAVKINDYLHSIYGFVFNEEELLYLMLHINRLCVREGCGCQNGAVPT